MSNLVRTQVMLPEDILTDLRVIAAERDWSLSEAVRVGAKNLVEKLKPRKKDAIEMLWKLAQNPYKGKAPKDLSSNDEYLYGKLAPDYKGER
ncbi:MAG: hypothetical protein U0946_01955 [Patescibacteria group bacterium]|nr:hypothetical protein [Patescibacteria group bacterium]